MVEYEHGGQAAVVDANEVALHFCLDNSGSMGQDAERAKNAFSALVSLANSKCSFTSFDNEARTHSERINTPQDMKAIKLGKMGQTNISAGLGETTNTIMAMHAREPGVHRFLVFLSDGMHSVGPALESTLPAITTKIAQTTDPLNLSVVVIGVTAGSSTRLGMLAKGALETVPIADMPPIFFCSSAAEMQAVIETLGDKLSKSISSGASSSIRCEDAEIVTDMSAQPTNEANLFISNGTTFFLKGKTPSIIIIDGVKVQVSVQEWDEETAANAVLALVDRVREHKVAAKPGVEEELSRINQLLTMMEEIVEKKQRQQQEDCVNCDTDLARMKPAERVRRIKNASKKLKTAEFGINTARNALLDVQAYTSSSSSDQAAFLNGSKSRYARKALGRAAKAPGRAAGSLMDAMLADTIKRGGAMPQAIRNDFGLQLSRAIDNGKADELLKIAKRVGADRARAAGANEDQWSTHAEKYMQHSIALSLGQTIHGLNLAEMDDFYDTTLREVMSEVGNFDVSYLSQGRSYDHFAEWMDASEIDAQTEYELLCGIGSLFYPILVKRSDATQVDPWKMEVVDVLPSRVDSPSLSCAMQCNQLVLSPEGHPLGDVLPLIDPMFPNASQLVWGSKITEVLVAIALCRDLHMAQGPSQRVALCGHALFAVLRKEERGEAQVLIALRIIYSMRKHFGAAIEDGSSTSAYSQLQQLHGKMIEGEPLTEAEDEKGLTVKHPVQLLLAMCIIDTTDKVTFNAEGLLNLCNEAIARLMRPLIKAEVPSKKQTTPDDVKRAAFAMLRKMLTIDARSVPDPTPVGKSDPERADVRNGMSSHYQLSADNDAIRPLELVRRTLPEILRCAQFALRLQTYVTKVNGWEAVMSLIEKNDADLLAHLRASNEGRPSVAAMLELKGVCQDQVQVTMAAQALIHNTSKDRRTVVESDVRDEATLRELAKDSRMDVYDASMREKKALYDEMANDIEYQNMIELKLDSDVKAFVEMLGKHAHEHQKPVFWALAKVAAHNPDTHEKLFLKSCNSEFRYVWEHPTKRFQTKLGFCAAAQKV